MHTLVYHDVTEDLASSGFKGSGANVYKLTPDLFRSHLQAISQRVGFPPVVTDELLTGDWSKASWSITFDDGGEGAYLYTADLLEDFGWYGHFFITTDYIGDKGFLNKEQIRELRRRGHVIGSHTCSHPNRMITMSRIELAKEWGGSVSVLSDLLGERVNTASVPCGFYSNGVGRSAAEAGIKFLFTSEPVSKIRDVNGCLVVGRFCLRQGDAPDDAVNFAAGKRWYCFRSWLSHNAKKVPKLMGDKRYEMVRKVFIGR